MNGNLHETNVIILNENNNQVFKRSSVDTFLLSVKRLNICSFFL